MMWNTIHGGFIMYWMKDLKNVSNLRRKRRREKAFVIIALFLILAGESIVNLFVPM